MKFQKFYPLRELRVERMFDESGQVLQLPEASVLVVRRGGKGKARRMVAVGA